ncbi:hypothetical protein Tco_0149297 [Tanacetum coccineum]
MRIEDSLNVSFDESLPKPKSSYSVEDDRIDEPIVQDLNGSPSLQVNVSDKGYPKSLKEARVILKGQFHCQISPSHTWDKSKLHDHLKPWAEVLLTNVFVEIEAKKELPIVVGYMLFCIETHTPFNFAYFIAKRMDEMEFNKDPILFARIITTLVEFIKNEHLEDTSRISKVDDVLPMSVPFTMDSIDF